MPIGPPLPAFVEFGRWRCRRDERKNSHATRITIVADFRRTKQHTSCSAGASEERMFRRRHEQRLGRQQTTASRGAGRLGWSPGRIEQATRVRRETASGYLKAAQIPVRQRGGRPRVWSPQRPPRRRCPPTRDPPRPATIVEASTEFAVAPQRDGPRVQARASPIASGCRGLGSAHPGRRRRNSAVQLMHSPPGIGVVKQECACNGGPHQFASSCQSRRAGVSI